MLISGALDNHRRTVGRDWIVKVNGTEFEAALRDEGGATLVGFEGGRPVPVTGDWLPGRPHARFSVGGQSMGVKIQPVNSAWRLRWRGIDLKIHVRTPRVAELARLMPEKAPPDTSKMLLCPMPGVVTAIMGGRGSGGSRGASRWPRSKP